MLPLPAGLVLPPAIKPAVNDANTMAVPVSTKDMPTLTAEAQNMNQALANNAAAEKPGLGRWFLGGVKDLGGSLWGGLKSVGGTAARYGKIAYNASSEWVSNAYYDVADSIATLWNSIFGRAERLQGKVDELVKLKNEAANATGAEKDALLETISQKEAAIGSEKEALVADLEKAGQGALANEIKNAATYEQLSGLLAQVKSANLSVTVEEKFGRLFAVVNLEITEKHEEAVRTADPTTEEGKKTIRDVAKDLQYSASVRESIAALAHGDAGTLSLLNYTAGKQLELGLQIADLDRQNNLGINLTEDLLQSRSEIAAFKGIYTISNTLTKDVLELLLQNRIMNAEADKRVEKKMQEQKLAEKIADEIKWLKTLLKIVRNKKLFNKLASINLRLNLVKSKLGAATGADRADALKELQDIQEGLKKALSDVLKQVLKRKIKAD